MAISSRIDLNQIRKEVQIATIEDNQSESNLEELENTILGWAAQYKNLGATGGEAICPHEHIADVSTVGTGLSGLIGTGESVQRSVRRPC